MNAERKLPPTLSDVARSAQVSLATASRVLNGSERVVREDYQKRVHDAAKRLGYSPNLSAQAMARGVSTSVCLVVADISDPYFSTIAAGVLEAAESQGLTVTISVAGRDAGREAALIRQLRGHRPRAIILAGSRRVDDPHFEVLQAELTAYTAEGGRVALLAPEELPFPTLDLQNHLGATRLAHALVELGYESFGAISAPQSLATSRHRLSGFREALHSHGMSIRDEQIAYDELNYDGGYRAMRTLLEQSAAAGLDRPQLVFAASDVMAIGAYRALQELGLRPGGDIAIAGYDDIRSSSDVSPALTTVHVPLEQIGRDALSLALGEPKMLQTQSVLPNVVVRPSTPRLRELPA